jgi:predicted RNA-binding protein Jag
VTENQELKQSVRKQERSTETVIQFCRDMIDCMQLDLNLQGKEEEGVIYVNLTGPDRPFLLSNSASALNCMEFLLNKAFRGGREEAPGIVLDSDSYRQHREAELVLLAQMAAKKVIALGKPLGLQPMIPRERRIVHITLAGIEGIRSQSDGEGDNRSVTIFPS